jgi:hypothetical protein
MPTSYELSANNLRGLLFMAYPITSHRYVDHQYKVQKAAKKAADGFREVNCCKDCYSNRDVCLITTFIATGAITGGICGAAAGGIGALPGAAIGASVGLAIAIAIIKIEKSCK